MNKILFEPTNPATDQSKLLSHPADPFESTEQAEGSETPEISSIPQYHPPPPHWKTNKNNNKTSTQLPHKKETKKLRMEEKLIQIAGNSDSVIFQLLILFINKLEKNPEKKSLLSGSVPGQEFHLHFRVGIFSKQTKGQSSVSRAVSAQQAQPLRNSAPPLSTRWTPPPWVAFLPRSSLPSSVDWQLVGCHGSVLLVLVRKAPTVLFTYMLNMYKILPWWKTTQMKGHWWKATLMKGHPDERPPWWKATQMKDHPDEKPPWWKTTLMKDHPDETLPWWKTTLMRNHLDERPPWWQTTLMKDHLDERPPWWETTLMKDYPDERPPWWETTLMKDHPDEKPPWWKTTLMRNYPDEKPPWWKITMMKDHPDKRPPWWNATLMRNHPDERPSW